MAKVCVKGCASYERDDVDKALEQVLEPFSEILNFKPGTKVVIKANLVSMMKPASAATTHPALLSKLCEMLVSRGAEVVVGDSPGGLYTAAHVNAVYNATGMNELLATGAKLNNDFAHKHMTYPEGVALKEFEYTSYIDDADIIINFCKLKTHGMMGMSACVKNMFGVIPGVYKPEYHYRFPDHRAFADMLIDLNERFRPALCLVDAVFGMEGNGPTAGTPRHIGAILAADSPYACDRICAALIGLEPENVETIAAAQNRKLDAETEIIGDYHPFIVRDYKLVRQRKDVSFKFGNRFVTAFVRKALCSVPKVKTSQCVGCEKCAKICPAKAIAMKNGKPVIERDACIRCFCCQEFCPKGAMKLYRPLIARIINK